MAVCPQSALLLKRPVHALFVSEGELAPNIMTNQLRELDIFLVAAVGVSVEIIKK